MAMVIIVHLKLRQAVGRRNGNGDGDNSALEVKAGCWEKEW